MESKEQSLLDKLRQVYVEKRLDLLKQSYEAWEKSQFRFLEALKRDKDLSKIERRMGALEHVRMCIEGKLREDIGWTVTFSDYVENAERRLLADYERTLNAVREYKDVKEKYDVLDEFRKGKIFEDM